MFENIFYSLMTATVEFQHAASYDDYGAEAYDGVWHSTKARVVYGDDIVRRADGESLKVGATVYAPCDAGIELDDKVKLPDDTETTVVMIRRPTDEDGVHHLEVFCGER